MRLISHYNQQHFQQILTTEHTQHLLLWTTIIWPLKSGTFTYIGKGLWNSISTGLVLEFEQRGDTNMHSWYWKTGSSRYTKRIESIWKKKKWKKVSWKSGISVTLATSHYHVKSWCLQNLFTYTPTFHRSIVSFRTRKSKVRSIKTGFQKIVHIHVCIHMYVCTWSMRYLPDASSMVKDFREKLHRRIKDLPY